jgi:hypothetical protein
MKTIIFPLFFIAMAFLSGCSDLERVDAATFMKYGEATQTIGSATDYELAGVKEERAFIKYWTAVTIVGKGKTIHYWIPLSELPPEIREGRNPWSKAKAPFETLKTGGQPATSTNTGESARFPITASRPAWYT